MHFTLTLGGREHDVYLARDNGKVKVEVDGEIYDADISGEGDALTITVGGESFTIALGEDHVTVDGERLPVDLADFRPGEAPGEHGGAAGASRVKPPMPGKVVELKVSEGDEVAQGDVLLILEAMKMQNEITAPTGGTVAKVHVEKGATVESKDVLVSIE